MGILSSLSRTESGGNFQASNDAMGSGGMAGHFGRLQFGQARLQDAQRAGVIPQGTTPQQFMADEDMQSRTEQWHLGDMANQADRMGLTRFIGQNVGGVLITMNSILAMGHLGGMGGARRYLESGGRHNPSDVNGTSLRDYAGTHGNADAGRGSSGRAPNRPQATVSTRGAPQMAQEQAPQGILGALGLQRREEGAAGPTGQSFYQRDNFKDLMGNLAIGFNSMTLNPEQDLARQVQGQQQGRRDANQKNRTIEWLRSQPGGERFAGMADSVGVGPALQAYQAAQQGADPVNGINVGGNLVNPRTGELMYQGAGDAVSPSSAIAKLQSDLSAGLINQEQYALGLANMAPSRMRIVSDGQGGFTMEQGSAVGGGTDAPTERQSSLALFGNLMDETMPEIAALESSETFNPASFSEGAAAKAGWLGNYLRSPEGQRYEGLQRQWAEGVLRIQTGAAATQDEIDRVMSTYFPQPGDTAETVAQKSQQRDAFARSLVPASGGNIEAPGGAGTRGRIGEAPVGARIRYDAEGNRIQ